MSLFDRKEDVIEFVLTPHGKKMFRDGTFNPRYYAFADTGILYDCRHAGFSGSQNELAERLESAPILKKSVYFMEDANEYQSEFINTSIIGSSELGQKKFPAFEVKIHSGRISGSVEYITSSISNMRIPKFTIEMQNIYNTASNEFISQENLLLEINEINGLFERENFEISLFELQEVTIPGRKFLGGFETPNSTLLVPLALEFTPVEKLITAVSDNVDALFSGEPDIYPTQVEYWFDILKDEKISEQLFIQATTQESVYQRPENNQTGTQC